MTSENELLPLPEPVAQCTNETALALADAPRSLRNYVAALQAENERLRAEVERLRADRDSWEQQASDRVADWHAEHLRAERLAEALRDARARTADLAAWLKSGNEVPADLPFVFRERWQKIAADIRALEAAVGAAQ